MTVEVAEAILREQKTAVFLANRSLRVDAIVDPSGLFAGTTLARPGMALLDLLPELVGSEQTLAHLDRQASARWELDFVNRSGANGVTTYWKLVALPRSVSGHREEGLLLLVQDISELGETHQRLTQHYNELLLVQRELAQKNLELAAANAELRGLSEMKSVFVSVAAHELRNPLSVILGYADILLEQATGSLTAGQRDNLEIVKRSSLHLLEITNGLLDLARIDLGRLDLFLHPLALESLIQAVVREFRPQLDAAGQRIGVSIAPDLPYALADEARAFQIIRNLVSNAHKYTSPGGAVHISLGLAGTPDELLVAIEDTGVGIPVDDQTKLFSRFFRASNAAQTGAAGAGLGLHITRLLVELHGGRIWLDSCVGKGTSVFVTFPVADTADDHER